MYAQDMVRERRERRERPRPALRDREIAAEIASPPGYSELEELEEKFRHKVMVPPKRTTPLPAAVALLAATGLVTYIVYKRTTSRRMGGPQPQRDRGTYGP